MDSLFAEIKSNTGVYGSVIQTGHAITGRGDLPSMFRTPKINAFAGHIRRLALLGHTEDGFQGMEFSYNQCMVVLRFISGDDLLMTFCIPDIDVQLIHLQHNVLLPEFRKAMVKQRATPEIKSVSKVEKKKTLMFRGVAYGD